MKLTFAIVLCAIVSLSACGGGSAPPAAKGPTATDVALANLTAKWAACDATYQRALSTCGTNNLCRLNAGSVYLACIK